MSQLEYQLSQFITRVSPDNVPVYENPPRFTWCMNEDKVPYVLEVGQSPQFTGDVIKIVNIPYNFYTLDKPLVPGKYYWRVSGDEAVKSFEVGEGLPVTPLPTRVDRYKNASNAHPRLWMGPEKLVGFGPKLKDGELGFRAFYENSVLNRILEGFPCEPDRYPDDKRVIHLWRKNYMACQAALCYIRSLSIAGVVLDDADIISKAKAALLDIARWDYSLETGSTTRLYNDECAYRVGYALAYGYDWLYNHMTADEREVVFTALYERTKEVAEYAIVEGKIHNFPYDSHAIRSLSMLIIPCCISMLDCESQDPRHKDAVSWLDYALEYLSALYSPWGGKDGGWAEGPAYWTSGMAFVTEAVGLLRNYLGIDLFKRPFFQKTGDYMLNCNPPDTYYASFGDQSNQGEKPGPKAAFLMRLFAGVTGDGRYQWYANRIIERESMNPKGFSNKGWWDLYYDDLVFNTDYGVVGEVAPDMGMQVKHFRDIGWVAVHKDMADFNSHIMLLTKSSQYGSLSHSHADQNTFVLFAHGEPLIINSGYYVGYGTEMHLNWRKQTKSANTILIDGIGQYAGRDHKAHHLARANNQDITYGEDKISQLAAKGEIVDVVQGNGVEITADATQAYTYNVPYLTKYVRKISWREDDTIVIKDYVSLAKPGNVSALLHAVNPFEVEGDTFTLQVGNVCLEGAAQATSGLVSVTQAHVFDGVGEKEMEGLAQNHHLSINTGEAVEHEITTTLRVSR